VKFLPLKVSVVINCYNGEKYIQDCIDSVFKQTYRNWEIIIWDNKSTDKSYNIIKEYNDKRIKYFKAKKHTKLYKARNQAVKKASGDYIAFLDVDDFWHKDNLKIKVQILSRSNSVFAFSNFTIVDGNRNELKKINIKITQDNHLDQMLKSYKIGFLTTIFRRTIFDKYKFNSHYNIIGDFDFILRVLSKKDFLFVNQNLCFYRKHGNNESKNKRELYILELKHWISHIKDKEILKNKNFKYVENIINYYEGYFHLMNKKKDKVKKNLKKMFFSFNKMKLRIFYLMPFNLRKKFDIF
jgi:glycosyltransferase involved in cell wall biosynthesis